MSACRNYVLLATPNSLRSNWVGLERQVAEQESAEYNGFKMVAVVTPDVAPEDVPPALQGVTRIQLSGPELDGRAAAKLLASLRPEPAAAQGENDVFVTRGEHLPNPSAVDPLPRGYAEVIRNVAARRVTTAGYRLAAILSGL